MTFGEQCPSGVNAGQNDRHISMTVMGESQDGMYGSSSANAINSVGE